MIMIARLRRSGNFSKSQLQFVAAPVLVQLRYAHNQVGNFDFLYSGYLPVMFQNYYWKRLTININDQLKISIPVILNYIREAYLGKSPSRFLLLIRRHEWRCLTNSRLFSLGELL